MPYNAVDPPVWQGKIAVEEAMNLPDLAENIVGAPAYYTGGLGAKRKSNTRSRRAKSPDWTLVLVSKSLADIHGRIPEMDRYGVEHLVLSLTSPGPQGQGEKDKAEALAKRANDVGVPVDDP